MALFCDFENVALGVRESRYQQFDISKVLERLLLKGSIVVKKAYCDWERYREFKAAMHQASFELIEIPHVRMSGKNSADIRMVVDSLDLCYTKAHVDTFVIISGDSDFSPLVSKLRENNKTVIGVGVKNSTSDLLIANCDEFIYYDDLVRDQRQAAGRTQRRRPNGVPVPAGRGVQPSARLPAAAPLAARAPHGAQGVQGAHGAQGHAGALMTDEGRAAAVETRGAAAETRTAPAGPRNAPASGDALAAPSDVAPEAAASIAEATAAAVAESARQVSETVVYLPEAAPAEPAAPAAKPAKAAPRRGRRKAADDVADAAAVAQAAASDAASASVVPAATAASPAAPSEAPAADDAPEAAAPKRTPRRRTSRKTTADVEAVEAAAAAEQVAPPAGIVPTGAAPDAPHMSLPTASVLAADAPAPADAAAFDAGAATGDLGPLGDEAGGLAGAGDERVRTALELVVSTIEALATERGEDEKIWGSMVKQTLRRRRPGFNENYYGFRSFNRLLEEARDRGLIELELDDKSGGYTVRSLA